MRKHYVPEQPLSGWNYGDGRYQPSRLPFWNPSTSQSRHRRSDRAVDVAPGSAEQAAWRIANLDGAAAAYELAGRQKPNDILGTSLLKAGHRQTSSSHLARLVRGTRMENGEHQDSRSRRPLRGSRLQQALDAQGPK
jgi:hypothetical protein